MSGFLWFVLFIIVIGIFETFDGRIKAKDSEKKKANPFRNRIFNDHHEVSNDPLQAKGDKYERHIGKRFEEKGDLVIYNGFIRGIEDGGVDLVAISPDAKTINLIQCKSWHTMTMELKHIKNIYLKLQNHDLDFLRLSIEYIQSHLDTKKDLASIRELITSANHSLDQYTIRKTLYIASEKVVSLEVGQHLTMIKPNIFRYEDMKIVVERI